MTRRFRVPARLIAWAAMIVALLPLATAQAAPERRVALVVGASAYVAVPHLPNTNADATDIGTALKRLGFEVDLVLDPDRAALEAAVRRLGERASGADAALFYFAGHGMEVTGRNWLLPVSAKPKAVRDLPFEALDLGLIFDQLDGVARVSLFILDSCRDSPFRLQLSQSSRGSTPTGMRAQQAASGSLIAYSTAPGTEAADGAGAHSPFTAALLKHLERPGLTVQQVFNAVRGDVKAATKGKQVPWESSALEGDFYFVQASAPVAAPAQVALATPPRSAATDAEELYFRSIKDTRHPEELKVFLQKFPNGTYAPLVRVWAGQLALAPNAAPAPAPPASPPAPPASLPPPPPVSPPASLPVSPSVPPAVSPPLAPSATTGGIGERLIEALRTGFPTLSDQARRGLARRFLDSPPVGRAIAAYPPTGMRAEISKEPSDAAATDYVLDRCAYRAGRPCALIAVGTEVMAPDSSGAWPHREPPRLNYTGLFEPAQIALISGKERVRADIQGYRALKGPKAAALRPDGFYIATAPTQREAEQRALDQCVRDPARGDAVCNLYAVGDGVVLPRWHTAPATSSSEPSGPPELARIAAAATLVRITAARVVRGDYAKDKEHKAIAVYPPSGLTFRWDTATTPELAERWTLEGCQIMYDGPCVLVGVDLDVRNADPRTATPSTMERVTYAGPFRLDRVPIGMERTEAVRNYAQLPGERAIAIRPKRALVRVVSGKATRAEAEREALAACNPPEDESPCFLYASGDQVVLPQRRTEVER